MANEIPSQFIKLDDAIKLGIFMSGESDNPNIYAKFKYAALQCMNELEWDVLKNFKREFLQVNPNTKSALLPLDYVNYVRAGVINQSNEIDELTYNPNIAFAAKIVDCDEAFRHCDCGCSNEVCSAVSNVTTTETDVVINGTTYTKTVSICTDSNTGKILQRTCEPVVTNATQTCNYSITFPRTASELNDQPYRDFAFTKNGVNSFVGDVADSAALTTVMTGNGFSLTSSGVNSIVYGIAETPNVWNSVSFLNTDNEQVTIAFTQSSCVTPSPTVTTQCYDEVICNAEIADCGCITVTDTVVNTLGQWGVLQQEFIQRYLKISDWQLTFQQPLSYFGYFNIDIYNRLMQLDQNYPFDTVYLEYYSANEVTGGDYLIPVFAKETIAWYCKWMYSETRNNVPDRTKDRNQRQWYNAKRKMKERFNPIRLDQLLQVFRTKIRP